MTAGSVVSPLDAGSAAERARQIRALAEPARLRILSLLAVEPERRHTVHTIAEALAAQVDAVAADLDALAAVGLLITRPGDPAPVVAPSPEAWVRYGRLVAGRQPSSATALPNASIDRVPDAVRRIAERLAYRYSSHFSPETVERYVAESYELLLSRAKTTKHLVSLTSRFATDRLGALAASQGFDLTGVPEVLFVCVQNAGRSQLAAGLLRSLGGERVHVRTAGSMPAAAIDPQVANVLQEIGIPVVAEFPKPLTDEVVQAADIVVTMGCGDACPVYPGRRYMDWKIDDPLGQPIERVRVIRDRIAEHVDELAYGLGLRAS